MCKQKSYMIGGTRMSKELLAHEAFANGVLFGFNLFQTIVIAAHKYKEPLIVGDNIYYLQDGRERLQEFLEKICK